MKIEYLVDTTDGELIRLFDFSNEEVLELKKSLDDLIRGSIAFVPVHEQGNAGAHNCHLTFLIGEKDLGITGRSPNFTCTLTKSSMAAIVEPLASFALHPVEFKGYEWLDETSGISLLIAPTYEDQKVDA